MASASVVTLRATRPRRMGVSSAVVEGIYRTCSIIGALVIWQVLVYLFKPPVYFVPAPSDVGAALIRGSDLFLANYGITLYRTFLAFAISLILGVSLGTLVSEVRLLNRTIYPLLVCMQSMPKVALAPIIIVWFGFGSSSKIVLGAFAAFFPVYLNTMHGLIGIDREQLTLMRSLRATPWQTFWKVKLPNALPFILAGANIAIVYATLSVIVAEFLGSSDGMGYLIVNESNQMDTAGVFANVMILSLTGLVFHYGVQFAREKAVFW